MKELDLSKLLKNRIGETFYCSLCGDVTISKVTPEYIVVKDSANIDFCLKRDGKFYQGGECILFPSKEQRDWGKEVEQESKVPKTWKDMKSCNAEVWQAISQLDYGVTEPILKSALALLKIHQLIEAGYGGIPTDDEWYTNTKIATIECKAEIDGYDLVVCVYDSDSRLPLAFHNRKQAEEFLSYPENVQLFRDFYMI